MSAETRAVDAHVHSHAPNRHAVIPTALRLGADADLAGRGVTIALLDSGFYEHPDLTAQANRVVAHVDIAGGHPASASDGRVEGWAWHGTQTSVVAAGNGYLSAGMYRGLASEARVALLKVSDRGRIRDVDIVRGLEWVLENREAHNIRIVNMSLGGDVDLSYTESEIDTAAEALVEAGVVIVVAAGNAGCTESHTPIPPANSPSVITVGGYDDRNRLGRGHLEMYCSSYGLTVDGLLKPEVIAPAIWVAAPIVPGTDEYRRAAALSEIDSTPDALLFGLPESVWRDASISPHSFLDLEELREAVAEELRASKIVATHYQHVDGTSFAAPIVASVVAQMLEVNPALTPATVKSILMSTADRIPSVPVERQGYGVVNVARAIALARAERHDLAASHRSRPPYCDLGALVFAYHDDAARHVTLAGDFNGWDTAATPCIRGPEGIWRVEVPAPAPGRYRYKFVVDGERWIDDPGNRLREYDLHGGFNSVVVVG